MRHFIYLFLILGLSLGCEKETAYEDIIEVEDEGVRVAINKSVVNLDRENSTGITLSEDHQTVTIAGNEENIGENSILILDLDTAGIIRKVTSTSTVNNETVCQTVQANMEDVFGDASFKLSTSMIQPRKSLKSLKTNAEISKALTDDEGFIHPVEIIYHTRDSLILKSPEDEGQFGDNLHTRTDFSGKELHSDDLVDFYISEGYAEFSPVFKFQFDYEKPSVDWGNFKLEKGELKSFKFWSDESKFDFKTMISCSVEDEIKLEHKKKLFDNIIKTSFKFMVGPVPVYITIECDIFGKYNLVFSTQLEATTGFQSTRYISLGVEYENNAWSTFNDFRKEDQFFAPELSGNASLAQRLEIYPHFDVKLYTIIGPNLDIVPFVYNENNVDISGYWNALLDLGIDVRIGAEVEILGNSLASYQSDNINLYTNTVWEDSGQEDNNTDWPRDTETAVVEVTNPVTGKTWMDRNLGASRAANSSTDEEAYGDLYQWGRGADGHEKRNSGTTTTLSSSDTPGHSDFITTDSEPHDWRNPQNDNLWQGVNGTNNPCPNGYRLPTEAEWEAELQSWSSNDPDGHFASPLKLPLAGSRGYSSGSVHSYHVGFYWSSTLADTGARGLGFDYVLPGGGSLGDYYGAAGFSVRCLKDATSATTFTVTTTAITDIAQTTATGSGNVYSDGGAEVTTRGLVYGTSETPTVEINEGITTNGSGAGEFTSSLIGLTPQTTYYVRAYATNSHGTAYGQQESFTTLAESGEGGSTQVVEVTNPETGQTWMDRNLGASRAATSSTDEEAYGDLYQWGRAADGHEKRNSSTTSTLSSSDTPGHGDFITAGSGSNDDWRSPQNDNLWQGVNGTNNPCPEGFRLPTEAEWEAERQSWSGNDAGGAFASPLKLPVAGYRFISNGSLSDVGSYGFYWSSTVSGTGSRFLNFHSGFAYMYSFDRAFGYSVRCLKD